VKLGIVAIGRNEGDRLRRCLLSAVKPGVVAVYVDSGSTDGSPAMARALGAQVVELDMSIPFTAARGRNAGFDRVIEIAPDTEIVQFVDGDCEINQNWLELAVAELVRYPRVAVVCGRRRERSPDVSIYNRLCDIEWNTPIGDARACGGDAMMRVSAFRAVNGFDPTVAAGEEPELCRRIREQGWTISRIDAEMTLHDAAILRFGQWWRRSCRGGYGSMDLYARLGFANDPYYGHAIRSVRIWTIGWASAVFVGAYAGLLLFGHAAALAACLLVFSLLPLQAIRIALKVRSKSIDWRTALAYGTLTIVGKWPQLLGHIAYFRDIRRSRGLRLIEYK
jgi:GT2 family glycosyltransferase